MKILAINGGSSSVKCRLDDLSHAPSEPAAPLWQAHIESHDDLASVLRSGPGPIDAVVHRIVHGGKFRQTTRITSEVRAAIAGEAEEAPAHNKFELQAVDTAESVFGADVPQVAAFDTAFHSTLEPAAYVYPGPYEWLDLGIRRYGFHGLSHQYSSRRAAELLGSDSPRLIVCHLGNGASLCAIRDGKSVDTTMGFTPLEGVMMGTRSGSIDPAILIYLMRHRGYTADQLDCILNSESGLLGVSGISGDMREILKSTDARAKLAFEIYAHRLCREIGAMAGVLGGADAIVFTGGVGENCAPLRDIVEKRFSFLNAKILVIDAEEEWEMVRECFLLLS
ncbi:MAG: acetate/propionate family kinase [Bryobacteraceae bacterium]